MRAGNCVKRSKFILERHMCDVRSLRSRDPMSPVAPNTQIFVVLVI